MKKYTTVFAAILIAISICGCRAEAESNKNDVSHSLKDASRYVSKDKTMTEDKKKRPAIKLPPISANVAPLFQALLERVWVTKYSGGTPSEIIRYSSSQPLCESFPDRQDASPGSDSVFLWRHSCLPLTVKWQEHEDLSGRVIVSTLEFEGSDGVIKEVSEIIKANSLAEYAIDEGQKGALMTLIKGELDARGVKAIFGYEGFFKTHSVLEGRFFGENVSEEAPDEKSNAAEINTFLIGRGKDHALTIGNEPVNVERTSSVVKYTFPLPRGFFGLGK